MTKQERNEAYLELVELKGELEKDRSALSCRIVCFADKLRYIANELDRLAEFEPGAHVSPDLSKWPTEEQISKLFTDCKDNKSRLGKVEDQIRNFRP